jgi:hypothetical protein
MAAIEVVKAFAVNVIWMGGWAQLLGMPVAWLRLRKTPAWRERPEGVRGIDLLAQFILGPTALTIAWGWLVLIAAVLGGFGFSGVALLVVMFGAPVIFVPWLVLQLRIDRFPRLVQEARDRRERKLNRRAGES